MDWIKTNYDRAVLVFFAVALLLCAGFVVWLAASFPGTFSDRKNTKAPNNTVSTFDVGAIAEASTLASSPRTLAAHDGSLLVSQVYILKDGKLINPSESEEPLHPPIKNAWIQKYGLDFSDLSLKDQDPDGDGFSNLDEFLDGTDPTDPNSHPPFRTKLRLVKFDSRPFVLRFNGDSGDNTYTINSKSTKAKTQFVKIGDMIQGAPYKVLSYEKKTTTRNEMEIDVSELLIQNTETGQKICLVYSKDTNDPTSYGDFVLLLDGSTYRVKKDDEFSLKPEPGKKFKLIDISAQEAQIQDLSTGEKFRIAPAK